MLDLAPVQDLAQQTDVLNQAFANFGAESGQNVTTGLTGISTAFATGSEPVKTAITQLKTDVETELNSIDTETAGLNAGLGFERGFTLSADSIMAKVKALAQSIVDTLNAALDIRSPSRVMMESGRFAGEGLALGLGQQIPEAESMASRLAQAADLSGQIDSNAGVPGTTSNAGTSSGSGTSNVYEANFNIQFSGSGGSVGEQRSIKNAIAEALNEWAESMQRTSPQMVEA